MTTEFGHGSSAIRDGKLRGGTDGTDYFYFFCPKCEDNQIMRLLDYRHYEEELKNRYDEQMKSKAKKGFTLQFQVYCEKCEHTDTFKISNIGFQCGDYSATL